MSVLITGGLGYIGSHTCVELVKAGVDIVILDNLCNSSRKALPRISALAGVEIPFYECDIRDEKGLEEIFTKEKIDACIHFAGLKAVGESCRLPLDYYENNIGGTVCLLQVMKKFNCKKIVFSSSATVYGSLNEAPFREDMQTGGTTNPYGTTKLYIERILSDLYDSDKDWSVVLLRYFNPIGAHESGQIGENPNDIPNNLMPYISQVAVGKLPLLHIYGNDYPTHDGTGVRDYIHVVDLALGHVKALAKCSEQTGLEVYNLGTGNGYSVLDIVNTFIKVNGVDIPYQIDARRPGDIATCYADASKAKRELGWEAQKNLEDMCRDTWNWQKNNPNGYDE